MGFLFWIEKRRTGKRACYLNLFLSILQIAPVIEELVSVSGALVKLFADVGYG